MFVPWLEGCLDGTSPVVNRELDRPLVHRQHQVVPPTPHCGQDARQVPWLDHHCDVEVEPNAEPFLRPDPAPSSAEEVARLNFFGTGNHLVVSLPLRPKRFHPGLSIPRHLIFQVAQAPNEALDVTIS